MKKMLLALGFLGLLVSALADPVWEFEIVSEAEDKVAIVSPSWHEADGGWLMTCRLEAEADRLVRPVAYLRFTGENDAEEVIWEFAQNVFRKRFDKNQGSKVIAFTRVQLPEVPGEVKKVKVQFVNEPPPEK